MVGDFLQKLSSELSCSFKEIEQNIHFIFFFTDNVQIDIKKIEDIIYITSNISPCPQEYKQEIFTHLMKANLLGQKTKRAAIGLDEKEKFLTLSYKMAYEENYEIFKEEIEDFVNYLIYWDEEIKNLKKMLNAKIL